MKHDRQIPAEGGPEVVLDTPWARFERAVDAAAKGGPHKITPKPLNKKERPASKGRVHKGKTRS